MSPMSQMSTQGPPSGAYSSVSTPLTPVDTAANFELYGGNGLDSGFLDQNGNPLSMPLFGGDGYSRSPFAMADDFTAGYSMSRIKASHRQVDLGTAPCPLGLLPLWMTRAAHLAEHMV